MQYDIVDESDLAEFRATELVPSRLLERINANVWLLMRLPVGVGKSVAADRLLLDPTVYDRFDLVIYAAPTWNIIRERKIVSGAAKSPVPWTILKPRPKDLCGDLDAEWTELESQGCTALAKATLCAKCPMSARCGWPDRYRDLDGLRLIFCTEQQFILNRTLVYFLKRLAKADRTLVIFDEAKLLDIDFDIALDPDELGMMRDAVVAVTRPGGVKSSTSETVTRIINWLINCHDRDATEYVEFPHALNQKAFLIQREGVAQFGDQFRYLGYDLGLLPYSDPTSRWKEGRGTFHFKARPIQQTHLLLLSAHLPAKYAGHRLGHGKIASPFETTQFRHSETKIWNIRNRSGADSYFKSNRKQILDTFALLIARNIAEGRSTLLISRKKSKRECADYLEARIRAWGVDVRLVPEDYESLPKNPSPTIIPVLHYGILGVNDFTEYESAYCLNSYYVSQRLLNDKIVHSHPAEFRVELLIRSGPQRRRYVEVAPASGRDLDHSYLGNLYLRKLEMDPVIQAAGRVRFITRPREVVFFQMNDLDREFPQCQDVDSLEALREAMELPRPADFDDAMRAQTVEILTSKGWSMAKIARWYGVHRSTLYRAIERQKCRKTPYIDNALRGFATLCGAKLDREVA